MAIERSGRRVAAVRMARIARSLLDASTLCAIATVSPRGIAHVNTAYFAWTSKLHIIWLSDPGARHSANIRADPSVAIAVFDSGQTWGGADRGIQLFGNAREVGGGASARDAERAYADRFQAYSAHELTEYRFYRFRPARIKLFDERTLGEGWFVAARVGSRGQLTWERTEIYHAT